MNNAVTRLECVYVVVLQTMQNHASVFRDGPTLKEGCEKMAKIYEGMEDLKVKKFFTFFCRIITLILWTTLFDHVTFVLLI